MTKAKFTRKTNCIGLEYDNKDIFKQFLTNQLSHIDESNYRIKHHIELKPSIELIFEEETPFENVKYIFDFKSIKLYYSGGQYHSAYGQFYLKKETYNKIESILSEEDILLRKRIEEGNQAFDSNDINSVYYSVNYYEDKYMIATEDWNYFARNKLKLKIAKGIFQLINQWVYSDFIKNHVNNIPEEPIFINYDF